jgi:multidrug efflux pump subunit AcrB
MRFTHTFIDRPILATVLSVFLTLIGLGALAILPVAQYPEIVPRTWSARRSRRRWSRKSTASRT